MSDRVGDSELCCRQLLCFRGKDGGGEGKKEMECRGGETETEWGGIWQAAMS